MRATRGRPCSIVAVAVMLVVGLAQPARAQGGQGERRIMPASAQSGQADRRVMPVQATRCVALVIGNDRYAEAPLGNAVKDATKVASALRQAGYDVTLATDVTLRRLTETVDTFVATLRPQDRVVFYYAGHGFALEQENYLAPVDFAARDRADAPYQGYLARRIQDRIASAGVTLQVFVLDACRNNPFGSVRSSTGGWVSMMAVGAAYIALATEPGRVANDNGLFADALARTITTQDLSLDQIFAEVAGEVQKGSRGEQKPWVQAMAGVGQARIRCGAASCGPALPAGALSIVTDGGVEPKFTAGVAMPDGSEGWTQEKATPCTMRLAYPGGVSWGAAYVVHGTIGQKDDQVPIDVSGYSSLVIRMQSADATSVRIGLKEAGREAGDFYPQVEERNITRDMRDHVIALSGFRRINLKKAYVVVELLFTGKRPQAIDVQSIYFAR
jgi:hypothetical protein